MFDAYLSGVDKEPPAGACEIIAPLLRHAFQLADGDPATIERIVALADSAVWSFSPQPLRNRILILGDILRNAGARSIADAAGRLTRPNEFGDQTGFRQFSQSALLIIEDAKRVNYMLNTVACCVPNDVGELVSRALAYLTRADLEILSVGLEKNMASATKHHDRASRSDL